MKLEILFENEDYVIVNKPPHVLSVPDRLDDTLTSCAQLLKQQYGEIFTVHRIDKETSGVLFFAKNAVSHKHASQLFEQRLTTKKYIAYCHGKFANKEGRIEQALMEHPTKKGTMVINNAKGKTAITTYSVLDEAGMYSMLECEILTGRTHQIRVHMKYLEHPILCDVLYGDAKPIFVSAIKRKFNLSKDVEEEQPILSRLALHASYLALTDSKNNQIEIHAPLPKDMTATWKQIKKWMK